MTPTRLTRYHLTHLRRAARDIQALFAGRSTLQEIVARDLQRTLRVSFPTAVINDTAPVLLTPRYRYANKTIAPDGHDRSTLVDALIERFTDGVWVDYTQGQRLTDQPQINPAPVSGLKNLNVQDAINQRGPHLLEQCQQALIDDWMDFSIEARTRFESLSILLKQTLKRLSSPTLVPDAAQRQIINDVLRVPDNNLRTGTTRVYLVDQWGESGSQHLELLRGLVLVGSGSTGQTVILFTLSAGIEVFQSVTELGSALLKLLTGLPPSRSMQWRLYEPRSNVFDSLALTFLAKQLSDLELGVALGRQSAYWGPGLMDYAQWLATGDFDSLRLNDNHELTELYAALPEWVKGAQRDVRLLFSQSLQNFGELFKQANWKFFDDGVPSLLDFTRQRLIAAYPSPSTIEPVDVIITVHTVRGVSAAGGFPVKIITTLLQAALDNLASLPGDAITITLRDGASMPSWLTRDAVKELVSKVDIGENYPKAVAAKLKDLPDEVAWRSRNFIQQLRLELPMLALEFYARRSSGFTRQGYETVAAVMKAQAAERMLGSQVIVLRPLAFKTSANAGADVVMNMFVIGPRDVSRGPVVLYRPMASPKLMEFAGHDALLGAIRQAGALQQQVLAWMSADARVIYQNNGFSAPHFNTLDGLALLIDAFSSRPALLASEEVQGDYGQHLYHSQVQALLEQADRQSVSNRENLWARRMEGLSLGLNSVMPFVTGPLAVVGWLLMAWSVHEQITAAGQGTEDDKDSVLVGFFLNMALVLMHDSTGPAASERFNARRRAETAEDEPAQGRMPELEVTPARVPTVPADSVTPVVQLPVMDAGRDVSPPTARIAYGWSAVSRLTPSQVADLKTFTVTKPATATVSTREATLGLFQSEGLWYAEVADDCFNVTVAEGQVRVVSASGRAGPWLKSDGKGRWSLDLKVRLLGGAPTRPPISDAGVQALKARFTELFNEYTGAEEPDFLALETLRKEGNLETRRASLDREADSVGLMLQRARLLVDLLEQRRRVEIVQGYSALRRRFLATQVRCLRFQVRLMELRRTALYERLSDPADIYLLTLHEVSKRHPSEAMRQGLSGIASLHAQAVEVCREQRRVFEEMLKTVVPGEQVVSALDTPEWSDKAAILAWQEAALRPRILRCLKERAVAPGMEALSLLQEVNLRCRLKLSSYRHLCEDPAYSAAERNRIMNETVDELAWLDTQLERVALIDNSFIDPAALSDYRTYLRGLREEIVQDLLKNYSNQDFVTPDGAGASGRIIHSRHYGALIASLREGEGSSPQSQSEMVEFVDPYTRATFARFAKSEVNGQIDWVYRPVESAQVISWKPQAYLYRLQLAQQGAAVLARLPGLEQNLLITPRAVRAEMELLAEELFDEVQRATAEHNSAEQEDPLAKTLIDKLTQTANALIRAAREAQHRMVLAREPNVEGVEDLLAEGVVEIKEVLDTKRAPGAGKPPLFRSFYIQKVKAASDAPEIVWFAHFHYAAEHTGNALGFSSAHFKANTNHVVGFDQLLRAAQGDAEKLLRVYRMTIKREAAQQLFFSDEMPSTQ